MCRLGPQERGIYFADEIVIDLRLEVLVAQKRNLRAIGIPLSCSRANTGDIVIFFDFKHAYRFQRQVGSFKEQQFSSLKKL